MFGRMYNFRTANLSAILIVVGFLWHYIPMFVLGLRGMPRRYHDYLPQFEGLNFFAGIGAFLMVVGIGLLLWTLVRSLKNGERASNDPWGGTTLEWAIPSPPPVHNFEETPQVKDYPYDFSDVIKRFQKEE